MARTPGSGFVTEAMLEDALSGNGTPGSGTVELTPHPDWPWAVIVNSEGGTPTPGNAAPQVTINTGATVITGLDATLAWSATDADSDPLIYSVAWGDGQTTSAATSPASHTYAGAGEYVATVTASDGNGGTGTAEHTFDAVDPSSSVSPYGAAVLDSAPLVYLPLDEAAAPPVDRVGTVTATSAAWPTFGAVGIGDGLTAADYGPPGQSISLGRPAALDNLAAFTVELLVQPDANSGAQYLIARDDASSARAFFLRRTSQTFVLTKLAGGGSLTSGNYPAGSTYHVVGTFDGTTLRLYVNGVEIGTGAASTGSLGAPAQDWTLGRRIASDTALDGRMAGVAIYDRALTPAEITDHKNAAGIPA